MPADTAGLVNLCVGGNLAGKTRTALNSPVSREDVMAGNASRQEGTEGDMFIVFLIKRPVAITLLCRSELHAGISPLPGKRGAEPAAGHRKSSAIRPDWRPKGSRLLRTPSIQTGARVSLGNLFHRTMMLTSNTRATCPTLLSALDERCGDQRIQSCALYNCNTVASDPNFYETTNADLVRLWAKGLFVSSPAPTSRISLVTSSNKVVIPGSSRPA